MSAFAESSRSGAKLRISGRERQLNTAKQTLTKTRRTTALSPFETFNDPAALVKMGGNRTFSASAKSNGASREADIQAAINTRSILHRRMATPTPELSSVVAAGSFSEHRRPTSNKSWAMAGFNAGRITDARSAWKPLCLCRLRSRQCAQAGCQG